MEPQDNIIDTIDQVKAANDAPTIQIHNQSASNEHHPMPDLGKEI